ncbi:hypothetical protein ABIB40_000602 [Pedobacter sp. UYP30]|uniref:DUF4271 domain-containing protein n=1 Tax=Pedobacter sp. UYP30 TaxID=1756400 RepID=UPI003396721B
MAKRYFLVLMFGAFFNVCFAFILAPQQQDSIQSSPNITYKKKIDPGFIAKQKIITDSIISHTWVLPDSLINRSALLDSVEKDYVFPTLNLWAWQQKYKAYKKPNNPYKLGKPVPKGNPLFLGLIFVMLIIFGVLKFSFPNQFAAIVNSFFSKRALVNINKEESLLNSWPFLLLFLLFGLIFGMYLFLVAQHYQLPQARNGFKFLFGVSGFIVLLLALKLLFLRFLGFLFNLQKPVSEYISILYLSYFNVSILFAPLVVAYALSPLAYANLFIAVGCLLLVIVFVFQVLRVATTILSVNRFSKVHLFLYFCALEICPILILIKAIGL